MFDIRHALTAPRYDTGSNSGSAPGTGTPSSAPPAGSPPTLASLLGSGTSPSSSSASSQNGQGQQSGQAAQDQQTGQPQQPSQQPSAPQQPQAVNLNSLIAGMPGVPPQLTGGNPSGSGQQTTNVAAQAAEMLAQAAQGPNPQAFQLPVDQLQGMVGQIDFIGDARRTQLGEIMTDPAVAGQFGDMLNGLMQQIAGDVMGYATELVHRHGQHLQEQTSQQQGQQQLQQLVANELGNNADPAKLSAVLVLARQVLQTTPSADPAQVVKSLVTMMVPTQDQQTQTNPFQNQQAGPSMADMLSAFNVTGT